VSNLAGVAGVAQQVLDALPQTQCQRCGYPDCESYAQAIASGVADINQCPPGGQEGVKRLGHILGRESKPLNPEHGAEGPMTVAVIDEDWRWRMVTPDKGDFSSVPLNIEGRRVADTWDPAKDEAAGEQCKSYGAAGIMRLPGRLHITSRAPGWETDG